MTTVPSTPLDGVPLLEDLATLPLDGRKVLVRVDFNVPLRPSADSVTGVLVEDDFRIRAAMPTVEFLTGRGADVTLCTHLGRPHGAVDLRLSVEPVRAVLAELAPGVELLENLRFDPGEEANDPAFVASLVDGFDYFVNDAFGVSHRAQASVVGPPRTLPSAAGRLLEREVRTIGFLLDDPDQPFVVVVGGAKVADKLGVVAKLAQHAQTVAVGGAMAFTFLAAMGCSTGASLVDRAQLETCRALLDARGDVLLLPVDFVAIDAADPAGMAMIVGRDVPDGKQGMDIGPESAALFADAIDAAGTVFWNGPVGKFEDPRFASGTRTVAEAMTKASGLTVAGGGDTAAALDEWQLARSVDFVSTGGGASLDLLEHGDLPGLAALRAAPNAAGTAAAGTR